MPDRVLGTESIRRWQIASIALSAVGLAVSTYLALVHLASGQVPLVCSATNLINCEQVTTSPQSLVGPVPVAFLGVAWFLVALALTVGPLSNRFEVLARLLLIWSSIGAAFVLYLLYAELFLVGAICLWCTAVHLIVLALFLLAISATDMSGLDERSLEESESTR